MSGGREVEHHPSILNEVKISVDINLDQHSNGHTFSLPTEFQQFRLNRESLKEALKQQLERALNDMKANELIQIDLSMQLNLAIERNLKEQADRQVAKTMLQQQLQSSNKKTARHLLIGPFHESPDVDSDPVAPENPVDAVLSSELKRMSIKSKTVEVQKNWLHEYNADCQPVRSSDQSKSTSHRENCSLRKQPEVQKSPSVKREGKKRKHGWRTPPSTESQCERFNETRTQKQRRKERRNDRRHDCDTLSDISSIKDYVPNGSTRKKANNYVPLNDVLEDEGKEQKQRLYFDEKYKWFQNVADSINLDSTSPISSVCSKRNGSTRDKPKRYYYNADVHGLESMAEEVLNQKSGRGTTPTNSKSHSGNLNRG
ncbi:unnamed protein product [Bursaphelenchus okinawaensis]|uniref:Uncharacterized protein n=1 Tax=Bursaphelenchus okinawaensis TaxID=465554 RepID=A0A811K9N6_9BILA|nr:unnamed protein product [Bursaphelenchus okinawaensis]CAG9096140.1 unnamed protein product [Bursaphelenchus okinawaensis]